MGLHERAEPRFVWNRSLLNNLKSAHLRNYGLPLMHGCILFKLQYQPLLLGILKIITLTKI